MSYRTSASVTVHCKGDISFNVSNPVFSLSKFLSMHCNVQVVKVCGVVSFNSVVVSQNS